MPAIRVIAYAASALAYLLIVLGGVVRITGSGMGCGDHWPLCNGRLIPPLDDLGTLIEYGHRMVALALSVMVVTLASVSFVRARRSRNRGDVGRLLPALVAVALLLLQVLLGAVTVILELPPWVVVLHLATAMALVAALMVTGLRGGVPPADARRTDPRTTAACVAALAMGGAAVLLGALTANLGAAGACLGFPLCTGRLWPVSQTGQLGVIHWTHRLVAYALVVFLVGLALRAHRRDLPIRVRGAVWAALGITAVQLVVAAAMILTVLQPVWRAAHVAFGTAIWMVLVVLVWEAQRSAAREPAAALAHGSRASPTAA